MSMLNGKSNRISLYISEEVQGIINKYSSKRIDHIFGDRNSVSFSKYVQFLIMQDLANYIDETDKLSLSDDQKRLLK